METTASTKDLDRADIFGSSSLQIWYELHRQRDRSPVRELDVQSGFVRTIHDSAGSRLPPRRTHPSAGRPSEIRTQLPLYQLGVKRDLCIRTKRLGYPLRKIVPNSR
jgi:hypothetical protein